METEFELCNNIITLLNTIYPQLELILEKSKHTYVPSQQDADIVRNALEITNKAAGQIMEHLTRLGWKEGAELFIPVVDGLDSLSRAAKANNTVVFHTDFLPLMRTLMETVSDFRNSTDSFVVHATREGMPYPLPYFAGTGLEGHVNIVLKYTLGLAINCLIANGITPVPSPMQSSAGSPHSSMGRDGFGPTSS